MKTAVAWVLVFTAGVFAIAVVVGPLGHSFGLPEADVLAYRQAALSTVIELFVVGLVGGQILTTWSKMAKRKRANLALRAMMDRVVDVLNPGTQALPWLGLETHSSWTIRSHMETPEEIAHDKPFEWEDSGIPVGELVSFEIAQRVAERASALKETLSAMISTYQIEIADIVEPMAINAVKDRRLSLRAGGWRAEMSRALSELVEAAERAQVFLRDLERLFEQSQSAGKFYVGTVGPETRYDTLQAFWYALELTSRRSERVSYIKFSSVADDTVFEKFGEHEDWGRPSRAAIIRQPLSQLFGRLHHVLSLLNETQPRKVRSVIKSWVTTVVLGVFQPVDPISIGLHEH